MFIFAFGGAGICKHGDKVGFLDCRMNLQSGKIYVGPMSRLKEGKGQNVGHDFVFFCLLHFIPSLAAKSGVLL